MLKIRHSAFYRYALTALVLAFTLLTATGFMQNAPVAQAAAFTPGNIVVVRMGTSGTSGAATAVFLDEYTPAGVFVQTVNLPTADAGGNQTFTLTYSSTSEGALALSADGQYLTLLGYDAAPGTTNVGTSNAATINRIVAKVDFNGVVNTSTALNDTATGASPRAAITTNGTDLWVTGGAGGVRYTTLGSITSTQLSTSLTNIRVVNIFNGQLYISTGSGTAIRIGTVGTGLPTTSGQAITTLPNLPTTTGSPYSFVLLDLNAGVAGVDTLYIADDSTIANGGGLQKYSLVGGNWTANGIYTGTNTLRGLTGKANGNNATLYATNTISQVVSITDNSGYNASVSGAISATVATVPANNVFRGVAFVPQVAAVAPSISQHPQSQTINFNTSATLNVTASGTAPLSYQWYRGNAGDTSNPVGTNSATFNTPNLTTTTNYWVRVSNAQGSADSNTAVITVNPPANTPPLFGFVPALSGVNSDPTNPGVSFVVSDTETAADQLVVAATATTNAGVAPVANVIVSNDGGGNRTVRVTPAGVGYADISLVVTDTGGLTATATLKYAASAASQTPTTSRFHTGVSDASTAIAIDANYMLVADDENQVLRLYDRANSGMPLNGFDFTVSLGLTDTSGGLPREVDIEASARTGNRLYWLASHSNSSSGNTRLNRYRIFATDISGSGANATLSYVGRYDGLRANLISWDQNNGHGKGANYYGLAASAANGVIPEDPSGGGFNIEGFEIAPDGTTGLVGFRAPISPASNRTKALLVPVTNLANLVNGNPGAGPAQFGAPIEFDLGGRGIREIRRNATGQYVIIAGPADTATGVAPKDFRLYTWNGNPAEAPLLHTADLTALNTGGSFESIVDVPNNLNGASQLQLLTDNGDTIFYNDGTIAKDLPEPRFKKFRSDIVTLGTVVKINSTVALTSSPNPAKVNQSVTFTATVSGASSTPTGTVFFTNTTTNTPLGSATLINGQAVLGNVTFDTANAYTIVAGYAGNDFYLSSVSGNYVQNVEKYASSVIVTSNPNPAKVNQSVTFTATVSGAGPTPTGSVVFVNGTTNTVFGIAPLVNGQAVVNNITFEAAGVYSITGSYLGSPVYTSSFSADYMQTVEKHTSSVSLTSSPNPAKIGESVIFTATVSGASSTPTGTVFFTNTTTNTPLGSASVVNGQAVLNNITFNAAGAYNIVAGYAGSSVYSGSSSAGYTQNVEKLGSNIVLTSNPNPSQVGQNVVFTATVSGTNGTPLGSVVFTNTTTNTPLGAANLNANGVATFSTANLPVGSNNIQAVYMGDAVYLPNSTSLIQVVGLQLANLNLASAPNPSVFGQIVTFTATLNPLNASGTVTFTENNLTLAVRPVVNGAAVFTTSSLITGSHLITATYSGDATYGAAQTTTTHVVNAACDALKVIAITDDGKGTTCGTLSYALVQPAPTTITFALTQGNTITFTGNLTATVKTGVVVDGGACGSPNQIVLNGAGVAGAGLTLGGGNTLRNLKIYGFGGPQLVAHSTANKLECVRVSKN